VQSSASVLNLFTNVDLADLNQLTADVVLCYKIVFKLINVDFCTFPILCLPTTFDLIVIN